MPWLLAAGLYIPMRNLERWLHQHLFKVGWLVTKNLHTTTILYYTFFLPGVILNQLVYWLTAGIINVQAKRAIQMPQAQEVAQLRLDFIQIDRRKVGALRLAVISIAPLLVALGAIWFIWHNLLNINAFVEAMGDGSLDNIPRAVGVLTSAPDFWLWVYITFTIGNTMMPDFKDLRGWRIVLVAVGIVLAVLFLVGAGDEVTAQLLSGPVADALYFLAGTFAFIIAADVLMVIFLGTLEAAIERVTGDSATFENGKLVTLTRAELLERRKQEAAQQERKKQQQKKAAEPVGLPTVYRLPLPIPDAPGKDALPDVATPRSEPAQLPTISPEPAAQPEPEPERAAPLFTGRAALRSPLTTPQPAPAKPAEEEPEDEPEEEDDERIEEQAAADKPPLDHEPDDADADEDEEETEEPGDDEDGEEEQAAADKPTAPPTRPQPAFMSGTMPPRPTSAPGGGVPPRSSFAPPTSTPPAPTSPPSTGTAARPSFPNRPRPSILTPNIPPRSPFAPPEDEHPLDDEPPEDIDDNDGDDDGNDDDPRYEPFEDPA